MLAGTCKQRTRTEDIGAEKIFVTTPDTDLSGGVKNGGDASTGRLNGGGLIKRFVDETNSTFF